MPLLCGSSILSNIWSDTIYLRNKTANFSRAANAVLWNQRNETKSEYKEEKIEGNHGKTKKAKHGMGRKTYQKRKYDES